ncbi:MAG: autotransporter outer membrane beta-barrel domain-containing protein [Rhizobiales bacterium]|nr:autotransporter outer membrane beta-barrel domain-containing protein [Hyphomicrobiales bacterium]
MKFLTVIRGAFATSCLVLSAILSSTAPSQAGNSPLACSFFTSPTSTSALAIILAQGDVIQVISATIASQVIDGSTTLAVPSTSTAGVTPGLSPGTYNFTPDGGGSATYSCTPAGTVSQTDQQETGSQIVLRHTAHTITDQVGSQVMSTLLNGSSPSGTLSYTGSSADVSISLEQLLRQNKANKAIETVALGYGEGSNPLADAPLAYNVWARVNYGKYFGDGMELDGGIFNGLLGFDYRISDKAVIGLLTVYEDFDFEFDAANGTLEGNGITIGAYAGMKLTPNLVADITVSHTWLNYDNEVAGDKGSFDASRWIFSANLTGSFNWNQLIVEPNAAVFISVEDQESYVTNAAVSVASKDITLGRISVGPRIRLPIMLGSGPSISLWAMAKAEYDFSSVDTIASTNFSGNDVFSARIGLGLDAAINQATSLGFSVEGHGLGGGEYNAVNVDAFIKVAF